MKSPSKPSTMKATFSFVMVVLGINPVGTGTELFARSVKNGFVNGKREKFRRMW